MPKRSLGSEISTSCWRECSTLFAGRSRCDETGRLQLEPSDAICVVAADITLISLSFNLQLLPVSVCHLEFRKYQTRLAWVRRNCFVVNYRQCGKTRQKYLSSCLVTWDIIISRLSDAISTSGYIPTSGDIAVSTIEKFDLENIGRGLYWWNFCHRCHITQDTGGG